MYGLHEVKTIIEMNILVNKVKTVKQSTDGRK